MSETPGTIAALETAKDVFINTILNLDEESNDSNVRAVLATTTVHDQTLRLQLEEDGKVYLDNRNPEEAHDRLLHTLQTNDCREIIAAVVNGDDLANVFVTAGYRNHVDILEAFLKHGINVDIKGKHGWTALMFACLNGHEECVRFLLDHEASVDVQNSIGFTALMNASQYNNIKMVEMLLEKNANPDLQNNIGRTALMWASSFGRKEIVQLLLNHGADIELKDNKGMSAIDLAKNEEIKELIRNHVSTSYLLK